MPTKQASFVSGDRAPVHDGEHRQLKHTPSKHFLHGVLKSVRSISNLRSSLKTPDQTANKDVFACSHCQVDTRYPASSDPCACATPLYASGDFAPVPYEDATITRRTARRDTEYRSSEDTVVGQPSLSDKVDAVDDLPQFAIDSLPERIVPDYVTKFGHSSLYSHPNPSTVSFCSTLLGERIVPSSP